MPRLNHLALCASSQKKKKEKKLNSVPVVEGGARREGAVL